jgi:hypothetical protein
LADSERDLGGDWVLVSPTPNAIRAEEFGRHGPFLRKLAPKARLNERNTSYMNDMSVSLIKLKWQFNAGAEAQFYRR